MFTVGPENLVKRAVFFDLYGTLIDIRTEEYDYWVYEMLSRYLAYHSVHIAPEELQKAFFDEIRKQMTQSKETYPEADISKVFFEIMNKYGKRKYSKGTILNIAMLFRSLTIRRFGVFDGLYDVLVSLGKKYQTGIISDAQWVFAEPEIAMLGLDQFFKVRIFSSRAGFKKPDVRLFQQAMEELDVTPGLSVYIGDNPQKDIAGAKNAGMKFILFRGECHEYNGVRPDKCFYSYSELENILSGLML
jgi:putative hydrolase of the HAD superfamily